jgi:hypothetical protein
MRWICWAISGAMVAGLGLACDDKNDVPPEVINARQNARNRLPATVPAPTTQELLTGKKKTVVLGAFPLTLEVPLNWALKSSGDPATITLSGPANSGEITIQLVQPGHLQGDKLPETMMAAAKKEQAAKPHPINRLEMRNLGPFKVLEERVIANAFVNGKPAQEVWGDVESTDNATATPTVTHTILNPQFVKWSFTIFEKSEKGFLVRGLTFPYLRVSEYEQDKQFLEQMMKTLKYQEQ